MSGPSEHSTFAEMRYDLFGWTVEDDPEETAATAHLGHTGDRVAPAGPEAPDSVTDPKGTSQELLIFDGVEDCVDRSAGERCTSEGAPVFSRAGCFCHVLGEKQRCDGKACSQRLP
jgi:hypothetical protein